VRVQLRPRRRERGAVAVTVAVLMIPLSILMAFTVDFGMAYAQRTALATGSDSAALAIVGTKRDFLVSNPGVITSCAALLAHDAMLPAGSPLKASTIAVAQLNGNAPFGDAVQAADITANLSCTGAGILEAEVGVGRDVRTTFGGLAGVSTVHVETGAQAGLGVARQVGGVRPVGVCIHQAQDIMDHAVADAAAGQPYRAELIALTKIWQGSQSCSASGGAGNWGWIDCGQGNSASALGNALQNGCPGPLTLNPTTPPSLSLTGSPGNMGNSSHAREAMTAMLDDEMTLPVYDTYSGNGNNATFRVIGFITVAVCGFDANIRGACFDSAVGVDSNEIQVRYVSYAAIGQLGNTCGIGAACAYNTYVTKLVR
jgi:Flp pilus assembly protein TadG